MAMMKHALTCNIVILFVLMVKNILLHNSYDKVVNPSVDVNGIGHTDATQPTLASSGDDQSRPFSSSINHNHNEIPIMNVVLHVGPHKTGTTTIQQYSAALVDHLRKDGYEMPWSHSVTYKHRPNHANQHKFARCFSPSVSDFALCETSLIGSGLKIAKEHRSLFVSAEAFDLLNATEVKALSRYLHPWHNVTIVVTHRRYYDWLGSIYNQLSKGNHWEVFRANATETLKPSILDFLSGNSPRPQMKSEHYTEQYTLSVVQRFKKEFNNVIVMNMHDNNNKTLQEQLYCDILPGSKNTCEKLMQLNHQEGKRMDNKSNNKLMYEDIVYIAHRNTLINVTTEDQFSVAQNATERYYQDNKSNIKLRCPPPHLLDYLLNISIQAEKDLFPDFFLSPSGELQLRLDFEKQSKTKLCEVDMAALLENSNWKQFFNLLNEQL